MVIEQLLWAHMTFQAQQFKDTVIAPETDEVVFYICRRQWQMRHQAQNVQWPSISYFCSPQDLDRSPPPPQEWW